MTTGKIPNTPLQLPCALPGMMRIAEVTDAGIRGLLDAAPNCGASASDHAAIPPHRRKARFGAALDPTAAKRGALTKKLCGHKQWPFRLRRRIS